MDPVKNKFVAPPLEAFTGDLGDLPTGHVNVEPNNHTQPKTLQDFEHLRVTIEKDYPNNEPVITWDSSGIAAAGNITAISAQAKAGKTAFITMLMAGAISTDGFCDLFGSIKVQENNENKAVLVFDTEQAEADQQHNVRTTLKRAGMTSTPDHFLSYNIRQLHIGEYKSITDSVCDAAVAQFGGLHSIYIDGVADYITDVNSVEQATQIREYFTLLSIRHQCPVILVIHQNPGTNKERGHLGSEIQRKCYGIINITKEGDISVAKNSFSRKAGDLQPIHFKYDSDKGYHVEVDGTKSDAQTDKLTKIEACIRSVLPTLASLRYNELEDLIVGATAIGEATAKRYIKIACSNGWINKGTDGKYRQQVSGIKGYQQVSNDT